MVKEQEQVIAEIRSQESLRTLDRTLGELRGEMRDLEKQLVHSKIELAQS
jgi:hypothetical protein